MKVKIEHNKHLSKSEIDLLEKIKNGDLKGIRRLFRDQRTLNKININ